MGKEDEAAVLINVVGVPERRAGGPHDPVADMSTLQRITTNTSNSKTASACGYATAGTGNYIEVADADHDTSTYSGCG